MEKRGILIVNGFLTGEKYSEVYSYLTRAFNERGVELAIKKNIDLINTVGGGVSGCEGADFVIFWDKDHRLAEAIEKSGIPCFNSSFAIRCCDDKISTALILEKNGVKTPKTIIAPKTFSNIGYTDTSFLKSAGEAFGYPFVIKEAFGSFGKQVYLANDLFEAEKIVAGIGGREFLMQKFVSSSAGRDIRVNVVGGKAVASIMRVNENDFRSNVTGGGKAFPVTITEEQEKAAVNAARALGCDFCGVDVFLNEGEPIICEVNASMHFVSTFNATGINVAESVADHVLKKINGI